MQIRYYWPTKSRHYLREFFTIYEKLSTDNNSLVPDAYDNGALDIFKEINKHELASDVKKSEQRKN